MPPAKLRGAHWASSLSDWRYPVRLLSALDAYPLVFILVGSGVLPKADSKRIAVFTSLFYVASHNCPPLGVTLRSSRVIVLS